MELKNVDAFLNAFAKNIVDSAKKNLVDDHDGPTQGMKSLGGLYDSISYSYNKSEEEIIIGFLMQDYGKFVDKGVRGKTSTYPETSAALSKFHYGSGNFPKGGLRNGIKAWLKRKRFQWRDKQGRFMSYESMTYIISRSIYNKGIKANLFFTKPFEAGLRVLSKDLGNAFLLDVESAINFNEKK